MKYCKNCKMQMDTTSSECLFCNETLKVLSDEKTDYMFAVVKKRKPNHYIARLLNILNVISALLVLYVDYRANNSLTWSPVVAIANLYVIIFITTIRIKTNWTTTFSKTIILTLLALIFIGIALQDYHWALDYVLPLGISFNILLLLILLFFNRKKWFDYAINLLILSIFALVPGILQLFNRLIIAPWPSIVSFFLGLAVIIGIIFIPSKENKEEFKRRFHV
ncbi:MAG: DUF6320 domain-containing protein [Acholeplasmataceae bacterium]